MMTLDDAVELVLCISKWKEWRNFCSKAPAATIEILAKSILDLFNKKDHKIDIIGTRHGEKLFSKLF